MPRPVQQIAAQHALNVGKDFRFAGGVQTVTSVVDPEAGQLKTPGVPTGYRPSLDHADIEQAAPGQFPGNAGAGWSRSENYDP